VSTSLASRFFGRLLAGFVVVVGSLLVVPPFAAARLETATPDVTVLHTYSAVTPAWEIANLIPVSLSKLTPLLPGGYSAVPASALGVGPTDQGVVVVANFQGMHFQVDGGAPHPTTAIDIAILVNAPESAAAAGVDIAGAFQFYTLTIATDDPVYAASLADGGMPVRLVNRILYSRQIDDPTGVGTLTVSVPADGPLLHSVTNAFGYQPATGALNAVFWHNDRDGIISVLHFQPYPFWQGQASSEVYLRPGTGLDDLVGGGGVGPCQDPQSGYDCVTAPSLNFRYFGDSGSLELIAH
jgi:hypothetical protein